MRRCYFSKNYPDLNGAGNKAKTDIEIIMSRNGFVNVGLHQSFSKNKIYGFIITLASVLKCLFCLRKNDILVVQYPFKKYFAFTCHIAHFRNAKVVTVIHDLGTFRRKRLTAAREIKRLSNSDYIIAHNENMKQWLVEQHCQRPIGCLDIFDYLSETSTPAEKRASGTYEISYAGVLSYKKNRFLYDLVPFLGPYKFNLYGKGFDATLVKDARSFRYMGFIPFEKLIGNPLGDFGLVWDGESAATCSGTYGEYLRYNNPHKTSLYIRCGLPVMIWSEAAMADFVTKNKIGIAIDSLERLGSVLSAISKEEYNEMRNNALKTGDLLANGHYFMRAYSQAEEQLSVINS